MHPTSLDLSRRQFTRSVGPLLIIGTWLRDDENQWRPALVLIRASDEMRGGAVPCVVPLGTSWVWSEGIGDPQRAARAAIEFAQCLRLDDMPRDAMRIAGVINDHLPDLVSMPPLPPGERDERVVAECVIRDLAAGTATEFSVRA